MTKRLLQTSAKNNILIFRFILCFLLVSSLITMTASCAPAPQPDTLEIILAVTAASPSLAAGDLYLLPGTAAPNGLAQAEESGLRVRVASPELLSAAFSPEYSKSEQPEIWQLSQGISDGGAFRFGTTASPEEYIVIRCVSRADTGEVARLLLGRLNALQKQYRGTQEQPITEKGQVVVIGKYVLLILASDTEAAIDAARRIIR